VLKRSLLAVGGLALVLYFLPPQPPAEPLREDRLVLGTLVTAKIYLDEVPDRSPFDRAFAEVDRIDSLMSRYRAESELRQLELQALSANVRVSAELHAVLARSQHFAALSNGAFDCTVGALTNLWGFPDAEAPPDSAQLDAALALVGYVVV